MFGYYGMGTSWYYMVGYGLVAFGLLLSLYAQSKVTSNYAKFSKIYNSKGLTGAAIARLILDRNDLTDVTVKSVSGKLSDHYDPRSKTVNLSNGIYDGASIASLAIAAHECGHAIQHKVGYKALVFRNSILPFCNISNSLGFIAILIGLFTGYTSIAWIGVILMLGILVFQMVTLPVEFDASKRALAILEGGYLTENEYVGAKSMLSAAAFTYVAGTLATLFSILRIVLIILGNRRN